MDYRRQRDDVLEDLRIDYPDVPAAPFIEALKRLDTLCRQTPDIHRVLHRSTRGRQSFSIPGGGDVVFEYTGDGARVWLPDTAGFGWTCPA